eukprot:3934515-Alexandrium_andersonii.AAC.1
MVLLAEAGVWGHGRGQTSLAAELKAAWHEFRFWCCRRSVDCSQAQFTPKGWALDQLGLSHAFQ